MAEFQDKNREKIIPVILEYEPFSRKKLEQYLRHSLVTRKLLIQRSKQLKESMDALASGPDENGMTLDDRIDTYAFASKTYDNVGGGSSMHYDPDTLFRQYLKIYYEPFASQQKMLITSMNKIMFEQMILERINQCVDQLPIPERDVIVCVYINNITAKGYCEANQMGHSTYNKIKEAAFGHLLTSCNDILKEMQEVWMKKHA